MSAAAVRPAKCFRLSPVLSPLHALTSRKHKQCVYTALMRSTLEVTAAVTWQESFFGALPGMLRGLTVLDVQRNYSAINPVSLCLAAGGGGFRVKHAWSSFRGRASHWPGSACVVVRRRCCVNRPFRRCWHRSAHTTQIGQLARRE